MHTPLRFGIVCKLGCGAAILPPHLYAIHQSSGKTYCSAGLHVPFSFYRINSVVHAFTALVPASCVTCPMCPLPAKPHLGCPLTRGNAGHLFRLKCPRPSCTVPGYTKQPLFSRDPKKAGVMQPFTAGDDEKAWARAPEQGSTLSVCVPLLSCRHKLKVKGAPSATIWASDCNPYFVVLWASLLFGSRV